MCKECRVVILVIVTFCCFNWSETNGQSLSDYLTECEKKYGSDSNLVNGEKYFYPYSQADGDPFFYSESQQTQIRIKEKEFKGQSIKYDIFNQLLVLDYTDVYGGTTSLVLRNEWVESFSFSSLIFKTIMGPEGEYNFFQVITDSTVSCLYRWNKKYQLNLNSGVQSYYFTDPQRESFLYMNDRFYPFRNNKTFLRAFEEKKQKAIKQFIRQAKFNVKKLPDMQMRHLIEYCNSLPNEDS